MDIDKFIISRQVLPDDAPSKICPWTGRCCRFCIQDWAPWVCELRDIVTPTMERKANG